MVGKPYGLLARLKAGRIGSEPFIITECSPDFEVNFEVKEYDRTCVIERRSNGIILHFRVKFSLYAWVIPYAELNISQIDKNWRLDNGALYIEIIPRVKAKKPSAFVQDLFVHKSLFNQSS